MEAVPHVLYPPLEPEEDRGPEDFDDDLVVSEVWLMPDAADRIEAKLDRMVSAINDMSRELGAILARDASQEKEINALRESTVTKHTATRADVRDLELKVERARDDTQALHVTVSKDLGAIEARVAILMKVGVGLVLAVFAVALKLFASLLQG